MKNFSVVRNCSLLALLAALIPLSVAAQTVAPSNEDINKLIAHADSAADHQKLADYYKVEAQRAEAAAQEHENMLKAYAENASTRRADGPDPRRILLRYGAGLQTGSAVGHGSCSASRADGERCAEETAVNW